MSDITTPDTRTRRLSFLDAFMPIGFIIGLPIGTWLRNGPVAMFEEAGLDLSYSYSEAAIYCGFL